MRKKISRLHLEMTDSNPTNDLNGLNDLNDLNKEF
jgi:hypothetical protein